MADDEICFLTACELARRLRARELSAREATAAHLAQIERLNPRVNAVVTPVPERALAAAARADETLARGEEVGPLHGLPVAHKDLALTAGIRTTFGSPILRDFVPNEDALIVERLRRAGAITVGKTNTPEFGAGSQTYNEVFGPTLNPYDLTKTCGGSSGGAAVALACGMVPIADGSDLGGSLRNPASFCNVVGLRPSPGRVPEWPTQAAWLPLAVSGPMARTVADVALMLSAIAGPDARSPIALAEPGSVFARPLARDLRGVRIAWSRTLGGLPVDPRVTAVVDAARPVFTALGCRVEDAEPDFSGADEAFRAWRAWVLELVLGDLQAAYPAQFKDTLAWNIEEGRKLGGPALGRAEVARTALYHRLRAFMETYEFLIAPVSQVPPFDVREPWVREIAGVRLETYLDWMRSCSHVTVTGHPALAVPCGFTPEGLPIGLQIVGRHHDDFGVLQLGHAFEQETACGRRRPLMAG
jgi:amidase